jgi:hypothetical protein
MPALASERPRRLAKGVTFMNVQARVEPDALDVDARDTVDEILGSLRVADAAALATVLDVPPFWRRDRDATLYVADALTKIAETDVAPHNEDGPLDLPDTGMLAALEDHGYLTVDDLASETSTNSYLDAGRSITAIRVTRPFHLVGVVYRWRDRWIGHGRPMGDRLALWCRLARGLPARRGR